LLPEAGEAVLQIGAGSGFVTACLRAMAQQVRSLEIFPELADAARRNLAALGMRDVEVLDADALATDSGARYGAIALSASLPLYDARFERMLRPGGRLFVVVGEAPVIRQAAANRLAAREARPQALAALLPQLSGTAGISGAHSAGFQDQVFQPPTAERFQITTDTNTRQWAVNLRQNLFSWANWMA